MKCSKCDKEMDLLESEKTEEKGVGFTFNFSVVGISIIGDSRGNNKVYMKRQFGKYELDKHYVFCYECCLDALMGKSKKE